MKQKLFLLNLLLIIPVLIINAQECYRPQRQVADSAFAQGNYEYARRICQATLEYCPDVDNEGKNYLEEMIRTCEKRIQKEQEIALQEEQKVQQSNQLRKYIYSEENWSEGRLAVQLKDCRNNCKFGFIDSEANLVIPCSYDSVSKFSEGLCAVKIANQWGYINKQGNMTIPLRYESVFPFRNGKAAVFVKENKYESELIDRNGNILEGYKFRPEYLSPASIYEYAKQKHEKEEYEDAFKALEAYVKEMNTADHYSDKDIQVIYLLGCYYYLGIQDSSYSSAISCWNLISKYNSNAMYMLGECWFYGRGCQQNFEKAFICYQNAAKQNNSHAQNRIGMYYYHGIGNSKKDFENAIYWFRKAAMQENSDALVNLGRCYATGNGIKEDIDEAVKCYEKAGEHPAAYCYLGNIYYYGLSAYGENRAKALIFWNKAAALECSIALQNLGTYYDEKGKTKKAVEYWTKSARLGDYQAAYYLSQYYKTTTDGNVNIEKSQYWADQKKQIEEWVNGLPYSPIFDCYDSLPNF